MEIIRCREIFNCACLRCKAVDPKMVRVGAMYFCYDCFIDIFDGQENFDIHSEFGKKTELGEQYSKWIKIYKGKYHEKLI